MESEQQNNYNRKLQKIRIFDKNLAYIIGLPQNISKAHVLKKHCFLGQYGQLQNISINTNKPFNSGNTPVPSFSGHITYKSDFSVALVILALDHFSYKEFKIKASFGLTKYCKYYILNQKCKNFNCQYRHEMADDDEIAQDKQDMQTKRTSILTYLINHIQICQFLDQRFPIEQTEFPSLNYLKNCKKVIFLFQIHQFSKEL